MKLTGGVLAMLTISCALMAQTPAAEPEFEVASIKPSAPPGAGGQVQVGFHLDGARLTCTYFSLRDYLRIAYRVKEHQILGPDWMTSARFDIAATLPSGVSPAKVPEMMQKLLADRFGIALHRDSKEFPVYALVVGKGGPKMQESKDSEGAAAPRPIVDVKATGGAGGTMLDLGNGSFFSFADNKIQAGKLSMTAFADSLARYVDLPVIDMTELTGNFDFKIEFTPEDYRGMLIRAAIGAGVALPPELVRQTMESGTGDSVFAAVQTLGLKLDRRKAPLPVLVIDKAEKLPTAN